MVYEWKCEDCEHVTEVICKISERDEPVDCEDCSSENTKKVISACAFVLKGAGWAKDGYKGSNK